MRWLTFKAHNTFGALSIRLQTDHKEYVWKGHDTSQCKGLQRSHMKFVPLQKCALLSLCVVILKFTQCLATFVQVCKRLWGEQLIIIKVKAEKKIVRFQSWSPRAFQVSFLLEMITFSTVSQTIFLPFFQQSTPPTKSIMASLKQKGAR